MLRADRLSSLIGQGKSTCKNHGTDGLERLEPLSIALAVCIAIEPDLPTLAAEGGRMNRGYKMMKTRTETEKAGVDGRELRLRTGHSSQRQKEEGMQTRRAAKRPNADIPIFSVDTHDSSPERRTPRYTKPVNLPPGLIFGRPFRFLSLAS
jgi:hypothetical protein